MGQPFPVDAPGIASRASPADDDEDDEEDSATPHRFGRRRCRDLASAPFAPSPTHPSLPHCHLLLVVRLLTPPLDRGGRLRPSISGV